MVQRATKIFSHGKALCKVDAPRLLSRVGVWNGTMAWGFNHAAEDSLPCDLGNDRICKRVAVHLFWHSYIRHVLFDCSCWIACNSDPSRLERRT